MSGEAASDAGRASAGLEAKAARRTEVERALGRLFEVMERLLGEGGCPWDREQSPRSLRPYLLEETYELLEALDREDEAAIHEELGDVLYQVYFQAALFERQGRFGLASVARAMADKLVRRHPHVFEEHRARSAQQARAAWDAVKRAERGARGGEPASALDGVPKALPALARAQKLQARAARRGFDWRSIEGVLAKLDEERAELEEALAGGEAQRVHEEVGDLLFTLVNLARFAGVDAEEALREANARFERRFRDVERQAQRSGRALEEATLEELEAMWQEAKRRPDGA